MKTYDEMTEEVLEKVKSEKKRRRGIAKKATSAALAVVLVGGGVFAAFRSGSLTDKVSHAAEKGGDAASAEVHEGKIEAANDYGQIYDLLLFTSENDRGGYGAVEEDAKSAAEVDYELNSPPDAVPTEKADSAVSDADYSKTNVQVDGIDEADVVKTDGKYIYAVSYANVYILSAENGELETVAKIPYREQDNAVFSPDPTLTVPWDSPDIYIDGDRLAVVAHTYRADEENSDNYADDYYYWYMPYGGHSYFTAAVYDIADRTAPALVSSVSVSGDGVSTRMKDGKLYLVAADRYYGEPDRNDPESYIPSVYENGEAELVEPGSVYCGGYESLCEYLNVMEVSVSDGAVVSSLSLLGYDGEIMYQSADNIFVARTDYQSDSSETEEDGITTNVYNSSRDTVLVKISAVGELALAGSVRLDGYIHNSFSMDEYNGYLRVVTSVCYEKYESKWREVEVDPAETYIDSDGVAWVDMDGVIEYYYDGIEYDYPWYFGESIEYISEDWNEDMYNNLYVLDSAMNVTGKLEGLAPDERIYSCRFEGTDGYFVTYRETDPLFHVDLSDPTAPRVIDELTLPGHSDYLERFGDLLFGFGEDDEGNLKLSMFAEDEYGAMSEITSIPIPGAYYSEVSYDHHAILADAERGIICFGAESWDENDYEGSSKFYVVFWNGQSFEIKTAADVGDWSEAIRSLYIGDFIYLYVMGNNSGNSVTSFSLATFEQVEREELDPPELDPWHYGIVEYAVVD